MPIAERVEALLVEYCFGLPRIDRISARAKTPLRFAAKARKHDGSGRLKYPDPIHQIQDQIGARVVVHYLSDVDAVSTVIERYLSSRERAVKEPDNDSEFTYFGKHYILSLPPDAVPKGIDLREAPEVFELQIKTLFQHAWSEAGHDLAYKAPRELSKEQRRLLAFTSAQAWGADRVFAELAEELFGESETVQSI